MSRWRVNFSGKRLALKRENGCVITNKNWSNFKFLFLGKQVRLPNKVGSRNTSKILYYKCRKTASISIDFIICITFSYLQKVFS